jgi:hypothetical protein
MQVTGWRHASTDFIAGGNSSTHLMGGSVSFRAGLDVLEKKNILPLARFEPRTVQPLRLVAIGYFQTDNKTKKQRNEIKC